jgi:chromosome segregation ATPase
METIRTENRLLKDKMKEMELQYSVLDGQYKNTEDKLRGLQFEYSKISANIEIKMENAVKKEEDLKKLENELRNAPPKILDPSLRSARDSALAQVRDTKIESAKLKDENLELSRRTILLENTIKDLNNTKETILRLQETMKEGFIKSLNEQKDSYLHQLQEKNTRIEKLEMAVYHK